MKTKSTAAMPSTMVMVMLLMILLSAVTIMSVRAKLVGKVPSVLLDMLEEKEE